MSFHGHSCPSVMIICIQPQTWGASGRGRGNDASLFFFFFEQLGWCPPGTWCPTQTAAVLISSTISFISHRPDRKGTLASDLKGAPPPPPPPPPVHATVWHVVSQWTLLNLHDRFPESCVRCFKRTWRITDAHAIYDDFMNYIFWERMSLTVMLDGSNMASSKRQCLGMSPEFCRTSCLTKWFPGM